MKRKSKILVVLLFSIMVISAMTGCVSKETAKKESEGTQQQAVEQQIKVTIQADNKMISEKEVNIDKENNLLKIMKDNFKVEETKNFINSIDGVKQDKNKFWVFEINGKPVNEGAHVTEVKKGDKVVWKLQQF